MEANKFLLNSSKSKRNALDKAYYKHIHNIMDTLDEEDEARWEIYYVITEELIQQGRGYYLSEIKYRISDGENPNDVILDIINRESLEESGLLWCLRRRLEDYKEEDFFNKFY